MTPGQQYYGNLSSVTPNENDRTDAYWLLSVTAGDTVTVNWQAQNDNTSLSVFPSGTTDYNVGETDPIQNTGLNANNEDALTFQVTSDGVLPLQFGAYDDGSDEDNAGPYNFNVAITHAVDVTLSPLPAALSGTAAVALASPDGTPLGAPIVATLQVSANGVPWTTLGQATAANGAASIPYSVPAPLAGVKVRFRAVGSGSGYETVDSTAQTVRLPAAPTPTTPAQASTATTTLQTKFFSVKGRGRPAIKAQLTAHWKYTGDTTQLTAISVRRFPRSARLTLECTGKGCPTQTEKIRGAKVQVPVRITVSRASLGSLLHDLKGSSFHAGNRVQFTVSEPGHKSAVAVAEIENGHPPKQLR